MHAGSARFQAAGLFCLLLFMLPASLLAQRDSLMFVNREKIQRSLLKTNLAPLLLGPVSFPADTPGLPPVPLTSEYRLVYETPITPKQTFQIGVSYLGKNLMYVLAGTDTGQVARDIRNISIRGFRVQGMFRFYLNGRRLAPRGFYIGPHASYSYVKLALKNFPGDYFKLVNWNVNCLAGYQIMPGNKVSLDLFAGLGYKNNRIETYLGSRRYAVDKIGVLLPNVKFSLGFNFGIAI